MIGVWYENIWNSVYMITVLIVRYDWQQKHAKKDKPYLERKAHGIFKLKLTLVNLSEHEKRPARIAM